MRMSLIYRISEAYRGLRVFLDNKNLQRYFLFGLVFFLALGFFFNTYTVQGYQYDIVDVYREFDTLSTTSTGVPGKHSHKSKGFQMTDTLGNLLDVIYPQGNQRLASAPADLDLSPGARLGFLGGVDSGVSALLYNPPHLDVVDHLAKEWVPNYGDQGSVYARQTGYQQLMGSGISQVWSGLRNVSYVFFVLVFIAGGFMIMFRHKLGGQTIVTVYNTLPNIILGLILVTFSFSISGFIIDIGAVLINVIAGFVSPSIDTTTPFSVASGYMWPGGSFNIIQTFMQGIFGFLQGTLGLSFGHFTSLIVMLILVLVVLFASIRIFFALMKAYIGILIDTMFSPIVFALATIPGKRAVMTDWFYRMGKNVLTFVLIFFLVNLPIFLMNGANMFGGNLGTGKGPVSMDPGGMIVAGMAIYVLFLAGNVPKMLEEYLPHIGGRTAASVTEGIKKEKANKPLLGSLLRG